MDCAIPDLIGSIISPILKYISMKQAGESASVDSSNKKNTAKGININFPIRNALRTEHTHVDFSTFSKCYM